VQLRAAARRGSATLEWALAAAIVAGAAAWGLAGAGGALERAARGIGAAVSGPEAQDASQEALEGAEKQEDLLGKHQERRPGEEEPVRYGSEPGQDDD
jgi:hypothetical protein